MTRAKLLASMKVEDPPQASRRQSVSQETHRRYARKNDTFLKFIAEMKKQKKRGYDEDLSNNGNPTIFAHFLAHIAAANNSRSRSTAEGYRCAILHMQRLHSLPLWASYRDSISIVDGFAYQGKVKDVTQTFRPARAQVTVSMHRQMVDYTKRVCPIFTDAIELGFRVALRPTELMTLRKGSYDSKTAELTIPDKRANAKK
jgi:hypothetical protein